MNERTNGCFKALNSNPQTTVEMNLYDFHFKWFSRIKAIGISINTFCYALFVYK